MPRAERRDGIRVRAATTEDWPSLWPLLRGMGKTTSECEVRERLGRVLPREDHFLPVVVEGDGPHSPALGYAWAQDHGPHLRSGKRVARLHDLFVAPEHRRRGVGGLLLGAVAGWATDRGVAWLQWQSSPAAVPFSERLGLAGDPCPDPGHPFFEIDFSEPEWRSALPPP